jgi:hypothetical protein
MSIRALAFVAAAACGSVRAPTTSPPDAEPDAALPRPDAPSGGDAAVDAGPTADFCVDGAAGDDTNAGSCAPYAPFRHITRAVAVARSGQTIQVKPNLYSVATGETFPLALRDGVSLVGDELHSGLGAVPTIIDSVDTALTLGSDCTVAGVAVTSSATTSHRIMWTATATGGTIRNNTIDGGLRGIYITVPAVIVTGNTVRHQDQEGVYTSAAGTVLERNTFENDGGSHVMIDHVVADLGGGVSTGHNRFTCGTAMSWGNTTTILARDNTWPHVPPVQGYTAGDDVLILDGTSWDTGGAVLDTTTCP